MTLRSKLVGSLILGLVIWLGAPLVNGPLQPVFGVQAAQAQTVNSIAVSGNERVGDSIVISFLSIGVGDRATPALINASIDSLYQSGLFATVDVRMGGSTLRVTVTENPIISGVLFTGNRTLTDEQLLALVDLAALGIYSESAVERGARAIRAEYASQGFSAVEVSYSTEVTESGRIRVTYNVVENYRARIASITFNGNQSISDWNLASAMKTKQSHLLSWLFRDDVYEEAKLVLDEEALRVFYGNRGFPDAQVSSVVEFDSVRGAYFININIIEGDRYKFGQIGLETSIDGIDTNALRGEITTRQGRLYSYRDLENTVQELALAAADMGYPFAEVRPRIDRDISGREFMVTYLVDPGVRLYVERINIFGNTKTRDFVIRREFPFAEGDPFNRALLAKARQNLDALQYFESVSITITRGTGPDKVDVNVSVVEVSTGEYSATAGWTTSDGVVGELSLTERNFLGRGQYLRAAVSFGTGGSRSYDFQFSEPRFMGLRISKTLHVYNRITPEADPQSYGTNTLGTSVRVGLQVTDDVHASVIAGYERKTFVDDSAPTAPGYIVTGTPLDKAFIGYTVRYSTLDNAQDPTRGFYGQFEQTYAGIDHNFLKSELKGRYYQPILPDYGVVASVRGQAGIINDFSGGGVHPTETFQALPALVRGYAARDFGPKFDTGVGPGDSVGFSEYVALSAEVEFPIPVLPDAYGVSAALWADAAWVGTSALGVAIHPDSTDVPVRASAGASIIWDSPFGPLRGDFAYVPPGFKATSDETQVFQLTLQTLF